MNKVTKSGLIRFRVDENERQSIESMAKRNNMTLSNFIRRALKHQINRNILTT